VYSQQQVEQLVAEVLGIVALQTNGLKLNGTQKQKVLTLGSYLTNKVLNSNLLNWTILSSLQKIASDKPLSTTEKATLKTKLYQLIAGTQPPKNAAPNASYSSDKKLEKAFWRNLQ
jgi:hypothetical protein